VHWERHADRRLYSESSGYKRDPVPVSDRMCADRFTFLRAVHSQAKILVMRLLVAMEFSLHILAQFKPGQSDRRKKIHKFGATIKAAWG
jgi:hypothetical protein